MDVSISRKAIEIVDQWNNSLDPAQLKAINDLRPASLHPAACFQVIEPEIWVWGDASKYAGQKVLQEPYIRDFRKWNSNSGWQDASTPWGQIMQALSHFSYHVTGGECLLCDLQGGVNNVDGTVLTDPVILSKDRRYGVTDLGEPGMSTWFSLHRCNKYCKAAWCKPHAARAVIEPVKGTTMRD